MGDNIIIATILPVAIKLVFFLDERLSCLDNRTQNHVDSQLNAGLLSPRRLGEYCHDAKVSRCLEVTANIY